MLEKKLFKIAKNKVGAKLIKKLTPK